MNTHTGVISRLFLVASDGKIIARRPDIWSSKAEACKGCGTTSRPHEAQGFCRLCYLKWRRANNHNGFRDRELARQKAKRMTEEGDQAERDHWAARKADPRQRELIRQTGLRWAKKNAKYAAGTPVEYEIIPGHWVKGIVIKNGRGTCLVQLSTTVERVSHMKLRKVVKG